MEGRRRKIELDEDVADALEKGAADRGLSLDEHLLDLNAREAGAVVLPPEELAELDARVVEWERDHLGYDADETFAWLRDQIEGRDTPRPQLKRF